MKQEIKLGFTDYTALILIRDTAGAPKTGLVFNSAGIDVSYTRVETDNDVVVTAGAPVDLVSPALTDPHLDWGFLEVDATNHPGLYRLDLADGVFAAGAWSAVVTLIATGIDPVHIEYILVASIGADGKVLVSTDAQDLSGTLDVNTKTATLTALDSILKTSTFALAIADAIWDEILTGATHNVGTSAGRRLRAIGTDVAIQRENTCQAGEDSTHVKLDGGASGTNNFYDHMWIYLTGGTGSGQVRLMDSYVGGTFVAEIHPAWLTSPDATSTFTIIAQAQMNTHEISPEGLTGLQAELEENGASVLDTIQDRLPAALVGGRIDADMGAISTSTGAADKLEASAETIIIGAAEAGTLSTTQMSTDLTEATNDHYIGRIIIWTSGVLIGQATDITDYVGVNGVLTFTTVTDTPTAADTFVIV